jgi:Zn finger protein HypA/HybF involved in hydrogenase expression
MHEHGIADQVLDAVLQQPDRPPDARPVAVTVLVSELAGLTPEALQSALDHVCEHHGLPSIRLELRTAELVGECRECGRVQAVSEDLKCPACGSQDVRLCAGETVLIQAVEYA